MENQIKGTDQDHAEKCIEISRDQYKKDLTDAEDKNLVQAFGLHQMIKKYESYAKASSCTTVKLICSNIVQDLKNVLSITEINANKIIQ